MFDTLYGFYRNQQKARQQAGLNQPFSTGLPEGIPNGNIPTQEEYLRRIGGSANYSNAVPMLPPEIKSITDISVNPYGSFTADALVNPPINPDYQPQPEAMAPEAPVELPSKEDVIGTVDSLGQQLRPSDNPSGASIHDEAMKQINSILSSQDPKSAWQEKQDLPIWQRNDAYAGLIGVGLSLLSGASPIEAYQAAEGMRGAQARKDELANNKAYLLDRYTADSVSDALASGDTSRLKEKGMSAKDQFALQQAQGDLDYARRKDFAQFQNDLKGEDPGSWTSGGNGIIFNTRSGAVMNIGGNAAAGSVNTDGSTDFPAIKEDGAGGYLKLSGVNRDGSPKYVAANAADIKAYKERELSEGPSPSDKQVSNTIDRIQKADNSDLSPITGYFAQFLGDGGRSIVSRLASGDTNSLRLDIDNLKQTMTNKAVQQATDAGQSGINIQAEVDRIAKAFDRLDYSSPKALKKSVRELEALWADMSVKYEDTPRGQSRQGALSGQSNTNSGWSVKQIN